MKPSHEQPKIFGMIEKSKPFITGIEKVKLMDGPVTNDLIDLNNPTEEKILTDRNFKKSPRLMGLQLKEMILGTGKSASLSLAMQPQGQHLMYLKTTVPENAREGDVLRLDVVQRDVRSKKIIGGIALIINVKK